MLSHIEQGFLIKGIKGSHGHRRCILQQLNQYLQKVRDLSSNQSLLQASSIVPGIHH